MVDRARIAAIWWADLGFAERRVRLLRFKALLARRSRELAHLMHRETGKPHGDALLECALAIEPPALGGHPRRQGAGAPSQGLLGPADGQPGRPVQYNPLGVVGVIGPWNYPVFTPMGSIGYALAAGNAVVFKPSEHTPGVGEYSWPPSIEATEPTGAQVVTGLGETGAALCRAGVDKLAFTGSTATGKRVMATCAETLTPVIIEAGGKDSVIVDADADLEAAADATLWGACGNAGQTCVGVERVYVHEQVYDRFLDISSTRPARCTPTRAPRSARSPCPPSST